MNHEADHDQIGQDLQGRLQAVLVPERQQKYIEKRDRVPKQNRTEEKAQGQT
jgi:hypothetical protein